MNHHQVPASCKGLSGQNAWSHVGPNQQRTPESLGFLKTHVHYQTISFKLFMGFFVLVVFGQTRRIRKNKPRFYPQQPRNLSRNLPGTRGSEPSPEPSRNPWFGSRPGTAPEPILAKTPWPHSQSCWGKIPLATPFSSAAARCFSEGFLEGRSQLLVRRHGFW